MGLKILVVDDDGLLLKVIRIHLEEKGHEVTICAKAEKALQAFTQSPESFDLVITDLQMPGMHGDKLAEKIWEIRPEIPIILMTGNHSKFLEILAEKMGFSGFLEKPFGVADLLETIENIFA